MTNVRWGSTTRSRFCSCLVERDGRKGMLRVCSNAASKAGFPMTRAYLNVRQRPLTHALLCS